jgi:hypothetical protein
VEGGVEASKVDPNPGYSESGEWDSLLVFVLWPDFVGKSRQDDIDLAPLGGGRSMMIYMRSAAADDFQGKKFDALELQRKIDMNWLENVCVPTGRQMPDNVACVHRAPTNNRQEFGLNMVGRDYVAFPVLHDMEGTFKDVYEERDASGSLVTLVTCNPDGLTIPCHFPPIAKRHSSIRN